MRRDGDAPDPGMRRSSVTDRASRASRARPRRRGCGETLQPCPYRAQRRTTPSSSRRSARVDARSCLGTVILIMLCGAMNAGTSRESAQALRGCVGPDAMAGTLGPRGRLGVGHSFPTCPPTSPTASFLTTRSPQPAVDTVLFRSRENHLVIDVPEQTRATSSVLLSSSLRRGTRYRPCGSRSAALVARGLCQSRCACWRRARTRATSGMDGHKAADPEQDPVHQHGNHFPLNSLDSEEPEPSPTGSRRRLSPRVLRHLRYESRHAHTWPARLRNAPADPAALVIRGR